MRDEDGRGAPPRLFGMRRGPPVNANLRCVSWMRIDPFAPSRRDATDFEILGNRARRFANGKRGARMRQSLDSDVNHGRALRPRQGDPGVAE